MGPTSLANAPFGIDVGDRKACRLELGDLIGTRVDHPDVHAHLGLLPIGRQRAACRGVDRRAHDRALLQGVAVRLVVDLHVLEVVAERLEDALPVEPVLEAGLA